MGNNDCELEIYLAKSGQWSGRLVDDDGVELGGIAGCESEDDVESCALEAGMVFGHVSVAF